MLDLYYLKPYHIVPSYEQYFLQQLCQRITDAVGEPVTVEFTVSFGDYFRIRVSNVETAEAIESGDDFDAILADVIANVSGQVAATNAYLEWKDADV